MIMITILFKKHMMTLMMTVMMTMMMTLMMTVMMTMMMTLMMTVMLTTWRGSSDKASPGSKTSFLDPFETLFFSIQNLLEPPRSNEPGWTVHCRLAFNCFFGNIFYHAFLTAETSLAQNSP